MRKLLSATLVIVLVFALMATPALAHHGSRRSSRSASYSVCTIEGCTKTGAHYHNSKAYTGHYYGDGHDYHDYCSVQNCNVAGYHDHDGDYCFGHTYGDGHSYHRSSRRHH